MEYVKNHAKGGCEFVLKGKITFSDHLEFKNIIAAVNDNDGKNLTVNLQGVEFIDSAALGMLLLLRDEASKAGANLLLKHPTGQVKKMFQISRFYDLFNIAD